MLRKNKIAVVSENRYYWIPQLVLHKDNNYKVFDGISFSKSEKDENVLLISDDQVRNPFYTRRRRIKTKLDE